MIMHNTGKENPRLMGKHEKSWVRKNYRDSWQDAGEANRGQETEGLVCHGSNLALILRAMRASKGV